MRTKSYVIGAIAIAIIAAAGLAVRARSKGGASAEPTKDAASERVVPVILATVVQRDLPIYLEGLGSVAAFNTVTVKTQVDGRIDKLLFKEGQQVKAGDLLAQIDPRPFAIQLHQAQAAAARDQAVLANAKVNLARYISLHDQGTGSQQQVDDARAEVAKDVAVVAGDSVQIESAQLLLDYARIKSPIDGVTGVRLVDAGNIVHPSDAGGIVTVAQLDPISVFFTLPEDDLPRVATFMDQGALEVAAFSRDGSTKLGTGTLAVIDNQIASATATIRLKATFANADHRLWPNQFVKARLALTTRKGARIVPSAAIARGPQGTFVYVLGAENKVSVRPVDIEMAQGDLTVIAKGLEVGEQVVVEGQSQLRAGARVAPKTADKSPSAPAGAKSGAAP